MRKKYLYSLKSQQLHSAADIDSIQTFVETIFRVYVFKVLYIIII